MDELPGKPASRALPERGQITKTTLGVPPHGDDEDSTANPNGLPDGCDAPEGNSEALTAIPYEDDADDEDDSPETKARIAQAVQHLLDDDREYRPHASTSLDQLVLSKQLAGDMRSADAIRDAIVSDYVPPEDEKPIDIWLPHPLDRFSLTELTERPPPLEHVIFPYVGKHSTFAVVGAGGGGKTGSLVGHFSMPVCYGGDVFGEPVEDPGNVVYLTAEDQRDKVRRHAYSYAQVLTDEQREMVSERLHIKDVFGLGVKLTKCLHGQAATSDDVAGLLRYVNKIGGVRLIILDTLSRLNGLEESNEHLALYVEAMEMLVRESGAAVGTSHHTGKAQARADVRDQYSSRGGSSLSDNIRSCMHLSVVKPDMDDTPTNATQLIADERLLRFTHTKVNSTRKAPDRYLERCDVEGSMVRLREFKPEFDGSGADAVWKRIGGWLLTQKEVPYPTSTTVEGLAPEFGSRSDRRDALNWATDRGFISHPDHPNPVGARKTYLLLTAGGKAHLADADHGAYREASRGY